MEHLVQQIRNYIIAIYIRLSSEDGDLSDDKSESNSVSNQREYIRRFIGRSPELQDAQILEFCDDGHTGTNFDRPAMKRLLDLVRQGKINCIIVKDLSRFGRDYIEVGDYLEQIFPLLGVRFIAINDSYDSKDHPYGSAGLIDVSFRNVIYDLYSKDLSEKVKSTKRQLAEKGYYMSPYAFFGYKKDPLDKHSLEVDEAAAGTVRRIFSMVQQGYSTTEIAQIFNRENVPTPLQNKRSQQVTRKWNSVKRDDNFWTSAIVRKLAADERYTGKLIYGKTTRKTVGNPTLSKLPREQWVVIEDGCPAIISTEDFEQVQALLRKGSPATTRASDRVFYRKVRCGNCRLAMTRMKSAHPYYICHSYRQNPDIGCPQVRMDEKELEQAILAAIRQQAQLLRSVVRGVQKKREGGKKQEASAARKTQACEDKIAMRRREKLQAFEDMAAGRISQKVYQSKCGKCDAHIREQEDKIQRLKSSLQTTETTELSPDLKKLISYTNVRTLTRELVDELISSIYVHGENSIEIIWTFQDEYKKAVLNGDGKND